MVAAHSGSLIDRARRAPFESILASQPAQVSDGEANLPTCKEQWRAGRQREHVR